MVTFTSRFVPPPGGEYFFEYGNESFKTRSYEDAIRKTADILRRHGIAKYPPSVLAEYMCPYMPDGFCTKDYGNKVFTLEKQKAAAAEYFRLPVVPYDVVESRISTCLNCPKHSRTFCLSCTGGLEWIRSGFRGARRLLPVDKYTGTCTCAGTFVSVIASVEAGALPQWGETPPTGCWRK